MMKNLLYTAILLLLMTSCNEWLDIQPEASVSEKELFSTREGFYEALNGIYTRSSQADLYGGEFSVGTPGVLAQNYSNSVYDYTHYEKTSLYEYTDQDFKNRRNGIWGAAYNAIANCNLILENIDEQKNLFGENEFKMIKGEVLALRAYLHFDMLRMFGSSYLTGAADPAIPYVTSYSNKVTELSTVSEVCTLAIADLEAAKELLENDLIITEEYVVGYPGGEDVTETDNPLLFFQNRRHRLNYYAVCSELARVYLYVADYPKALLNAEIVINSDKFPWADVADLLEADPQLKDRIMYGEIIFGWYADAQETNLYNRFNSVVTGQYIDYNAARSFYEVGGVGAEDYRFKAWFTQVASSNDGSRYQINKFLRDEDINLHPLVIPGIRLGEMYFIAAESAYSTDPGKAWMYLNTLRFHRGIGNELSDDTENIDFTTEVLKEYRKETFAEGQLFFAYKRLNATIIGQNNTSYGPDPEIFNISLPEDEIEFGNR